MAPRQRPQEVRRLLRRPQQQPRPLGRPRSLIEPLTPDGAEDVELERVFERFGLDRGSIIREIRNVRLVSPFATAIDYEHPQSFACVVDREAFDGHIARSAAAAGTAIELDRRVEDLAVDASGVTVTASSGDGGDIVRRRARVAVIASGVDCGLQKKAGLGRPRDFLKGAQAELPAAADEPTTIFVGRGVAPGAFAWSVPAESGRVRVGLLTRKDPKACLQAFLRARNNGAVVDPESAPIRTRAVVQGLLSPTVADRVLSVGEAAGQIKTTTGGGISYGLLCADMAADAILAAFDRNAFDAGSLRPYEVRWRNLRIQEFGPAEKKAEGSCGSGCCKGSN